MATRHLCVIARLAGATATVPCAAATSDAGQCRGGSSSHGSASTSVVAGSAQSAFSGGLHSLPRARPAEDNELRLLLGQDGPVPGRDAARRQARGHVPAARLGPGGVPILRVVSQVRAFAARPHRAVQSQVQVGIRLMIIAEIFTKKKNKLMSKTTAIEDDD